VNGYPPFSILLPNVVFNLPPAKNALQNKRLPAVRAVRLKNIVLRATAAIFADPWEILKEIPVYGVNRYMPDINRKIMTIGSCHTNTT